MREHVPPEPRSGRLEHGALKLHFLNPRTQLRTVGLEDMRGVLGALWSAYGTRFEEPTAVNGVISTKLVVNGVEATMLLHEARHGKKSGNVRVTSNRNVNNSLRAVRRELMKTIWFTDVAEKQNGRAPILPEISATNERSGIIPAIIKIGSGLGPEGARSIAEYIERSGMSPNGEVASILNTALPA